MKKCFLLLFLSVFVITSFTERIFYNRPSDYYIQRFPYKKFVYKTFGEFNRTFTANLTQREINVSCSDYDSQFQLQLTAGGNYVISAYFKFPKENDSIASCTDCNCIRFDTAIIKRFEISKGRKRIKLVGEPRAIDEW